MGRSTTTKYPLSFFRFGLAMVLTVLPSFGQAGNRTTGLHEGSKRSMATAIDAPARSLRFRNYSVPGALQTWLTGINNSGVIVGWYMDQLTNTHGFALSGGKMIPIDDPNGTNTQVFGINSAGEIVGAYMTSCQEEICSEGFLYQGGKFTDIGPPTFLNEDDPDDAPDSVAYAINDIGDIVGFGGDGFGGGYGFLRQGDAYTTLKVPGGNNTLAVGINKKGLVTVNFATNTSFQAAIYDGTSYSTINVPGAFDSTAGAINDLGDVVLYWDVAQGSPIRGALRHEGKYYKFYDPQGKNATYPSGLNDKHVIVGAYASGGIYDIHVHGFIAAF
jgi:hypothetical protein